ncbi:MAG: hypothetical protein CL709_11520 [Chloroflexi bacterium]|nr:hypothetical protein [Chloroflexota bacterium]
MDFRYYGIAELAIVASDIGSAKEFDTDLLGFEASNHEFGKGPAIVKIGENRYLCLWEPCEWRSDFLSPERSDAYFGNTAAPTHPVFAVRQDDVAKIPEGLPDAGFEVDGPMPHGDGSTHLYVPDPDNHAMESWGWSPG